MSRTRAFYSVVQYVPDGGRAEGANAGVALFEPETGCVHVRITQTLARIKKFFSPDKKTLHRLRLALAALHYRLTTSEGEFRSEDAFRQFVAARADAVRLTAPRLIIISDAASELDNLYEELVGDTETAPVVKLAPKVLDLPLRVRELFAPLFLGDKLWEPKPFKVPETRRTIKIPLAYQNGRVNFILPQSLASNHQAEKDLPKLGFDGLLIYQHPIEGRDSQLVVLSADEHADHETEQHYSRVLEDFKVRFIPYADSVDFAEEVVKSAH